MKLIALNNATQEEISPDAQWRRLARWYSKTFFTPLHLVDDIPRLDIILAYFEEKYENMEEGELHIEKEALLNSSTDLQKTVAKAQDDAAMEDLINEAKQHNQKVKDTPKMSKKDAVDVIQSVKDLGEAITQIKESLPENGFSLDFSGLTET